MTEAPDGHRHCDVQCPRCHATHTGRAYLNPDPRGWAQEAANERAHSWLETHPCTVATPAKLPTGRPVSI